MYAHFKRRSAEQKRARFVELTALIDAGWTQRRIAAAENRSVSSLRRELVSLGISMPKKLTDEEVAAIRADGSTSGVELAQRYGVSRQTISQIRLNITRRKK